MYQEEVYAEMTADPYFADYRLEQCQQDLAMLTEWKNLNTIQDTRKVASIEEFKNKKFRYQRSEYSVEIERLVLRLENLFVEGASLEPTLLERIRTNVEKFSGMDGQDAGTVYTWWNDLNNDFIRLNQKQWQEMIRKAQKEVLPGTLAMQWLEEIQRPEGGKEPEEIWEMLLMGVRILQELPAKAQYLAVFAAQVTGNPHAFDDGTRGGRYLEQMIRWYLKKQGGMRKLKTNPLSKCFRCWKNRDFSGKQEY
jgi:hypothetical protein